MAQRARPLNFQRPHLPAGCLIAAELLASALGGSLRKLHVIASINVDGGIASHIGPQTVAPARGDHHWASLELAIPRCRVRPRSAHVQAGAAATRKNHAKNTRGALSGQACCQSHASHESAWCLTEQNHKTRESNNKPTKDLLQPIGYVSC